MESYLLLKNKLQNQTIAVFSSLICLVLIVTVLATNQNKGLKVGLLSLGLLSSIVGITANKASFENSELLEDSEFVERETRISRISKVENEIENKNLKPIKSIKLKEPNDNWVIDLATQSYHFRICGETGSGKSTFIDNLITCLKNSLGDKVTVILIDPKYPLSDFEIIPKFKGISESFEGLAYLASEVESRLAKATVCKDSGLPLPKFEPLLFVIDEIDMIMSEYGKPASKLLKIGLKVGRALNIKVAYIGQSPLCSALHLNKNDFKNSANILLGEMAIVGMNELIYSKNRAIIENELVSRENNGDRYFALIKPMSKPAFTAKLPKPKAFCDVKNEHTTT